MITDRQRDILRHSLNWPECYRNHFVTGEGSSDFADCEALVDAGLMIRHPSVSWAPDYCYSVTPEGRKECSIDSECAP